MRKLASAAVLMKLRRLPSLPEVVLKVLATFEQEEPDTQTVVEEIARDQALTALVLRLANSPFYGLQTRIATLQDAVTVLGFRNVRAAVAGVAATRCLSPAGAPGFSLHAFWLHGTAVGLAARFLARETGQPQEIAFVTGLLHDVGILALLSVYPEEMKEVFAYRSRHECLYREAEQDVIAIDHTFVGEAMLRQWHFPASITQAVLGHHAPDDIGGLADIVHIADALVHAIGLADVQVDLVPPVSETAYNRLGLRVELLKRCMAEVQRDYAVAGQILLS
jgi:HD-like signal output (HDOD) protein